MQRILVIAGPTASGKSALSLELAARLGGEILNADSQQVYTGLDVGTAKPTQGERSRVRHHLLDVVLPGEDMDAARWASLADQAIGDVSARGLLPIVTGGTGLYLRALLHGVVDAPGRDPALRARLEAEAEAYGRPALHAKLESIDPVAAARIRENDLVRVVRALEIAQGGRTPSELYAAHAFAPERYETRFLALLVPREELHRRIEQRAGEMFEKGILDEARGLLGRFGKALPKRLPIGYAEAVAVVLGELEEKEAIRRVVVQHRRYARRQIIWLRRERGVEWIEPPFDLEELSRRVG